MGKQKRIKCSLLIFHAKIADSPYLQATLPSQSPILSPWKLLSILQHVSHISNITYILQIYETSCYYLLKKKVSITTVTPQIFNNSSQKMVYCWQKNWQILNRPNSTVGSGIQLPLCDTSAIQEPNVYSHNLWYRQTWMTDESNRSNKWRNIPLPPYFRDHLQGTTVSSCTAERKMPQAFSAPSAEPHKEARPQAASWRHLHGPTRNKPSDPPQGSLVLAAEHTQLYDCQRPMWELLDKGTRMDELLRSYEAGAGNPIHTKVRDMPKVIETLRLEGHLDIISYILFLKEGQSCLTVTFPFH